MSYTISVENIKCGGCANTITTRLNQLDVVDSVEVDIEQGLLTIDGELSERETLINLLLKLGYPETGTAAGLKAAKAKAKSFVSCAVGRINK